MKKILLVFILLLSVGCVEQSIEQQGREIFPNETISIVTTNETLSIASFNIQVFGQSKMDKSLAVEYIPKIIQNYDVIAIQEIRDKSGTAIEELIEQLPGYGVIVSERLGRTSSKEQYAIIYNNMKVSLGRSYVYDDVQDEFEREPHIVEMFWNDKSFFIVNNHIKPDAAEEEIDSLYDVVKGFGSEPTIILGDLNADCSYYDESQDEFSMYDWAIEDYEDTTVGKNDCTYDRILINFPYKESGVLNFQEEYNLTYEQAKTISDHYPVWVTI
jgi:endonuclease/exonuclease/phosphatase family metal-dependent hydrolase